MYNALLKMITGFGVAPGRAEVSAYILSAAALVLICAAGRELVKAVAVKTAGAAAKRTKYKWNDILLETKLYQRLSHLTVPIILSAFVGTFPSYNTLLSKIASLYTVAAAALILDSVLNAVNLIYRGYEVSKVRPIRGLLQVTKVVVYIIAAVTAVAMLIGKSPLVLLGGISAMTAVLTLVFKDAILGFVAGIQLTSNDMIRIGDWIEMPKYSANGTVTDLSLTTVKVENFDKTVTSIPAYALVSDAFINWRGMESSGARRIKRAIFLDAASVKLCDGGMLARFGKMELLRDYIAEKLREIEKYNAERGCDLSEPVNGRRLTNLGTFRAYVTEYLKRNSHIRQDMTLMAHTLPAGSEGIPLEIYCFADTTKWEEYESIQADIFDHLYSVVPRFGLEIYQKPSGNDIRTAGTEKYWE